MMRHPVHCAGCRTEAYSQFCSVCAFLTRVLPWLMEGKDPKLSNGYTHLFEYEDPPAGGGYTAVD
jgi:hypothetical protein